MVLLKMSIPVRSHFGTSLKLQYHQYPKKKFHSRNSEPIHECKNCGKDITDDIRVICAVCSHYGMSCPSLFSYFFILETCVDCFLSGVYGSGHSDNHPYRIAENIKIPILELSWTAEEEIKLLDAAESTGWENWGSIAERVKTKTAEQCKAHYLKYYVSNDDCLPGPFLDDDITASVFLGLIDEVELQDMITLQNERDRKKEREKDFREDYLCK